jgi:hypothetical protein
MSPAVSNGGLGCLGCVPNRPGKQIASCVAVKRWDIQSGGSARATATTLIASTVAAIGVLTVRMIVRMGLSPLHYARTARVAEVFLPSKAGGFVPAVIIGHIQTTSLRLDAKFR